MGWLYPNYITRQKSWVQELPLHWYIVQSSIIIFHRLIDVDITSYKNPIIEIYQKGCIVECSQRFSICKVEYSQPVLGDISSIFGVLICHTSDISEQKSFKFTDLCRNATLSFTVASEDTSTVNMPLKRFSVGCSQHLFMENVEYSQLMVII